MNVLSLEDYLWVEVMFVQSMIGAISSNFREITFSFDGNFWVLKVILEKDTAIDREEISDIIDEFSIYLEDIRDKISIDAYVKTKSVVVVSEDSLEPVSDNARIIFRRKEHYCKKV